MAGQLENAVNSQVRIFREGTFNQHASVEAVDYAIRDADAAQSALGRHISWLQDVKMAAKDRRHG